MPDKPKRPMALLDLKLDEVSLVDRGANPGARVVLFKRDDSAQDASTIAEFLTELEDILMKSDDEARTFSESLSDMESRIAAAGVLGALHPLISALSESVRSITEDGSVKDRKAAIKTSINEFLASAKERLLEAASKAHGDTNLDAVGSHKADDASKPGDDPAIPKEGGPDFMDIKELEERLSKLETDNTALQTQVSDLTASAEKAEAEKKVAEERAVAAERQLHVAQLPEDQRKAFDAMTEDERTAYFEADAEKRAAVLTTKMAEQEEEARKAAEVPEAVQKQLNDAKKRADEAEERAAKLEKSVRENEERVAYEQSVNKVKNEFANLPGETDAVAKMFIAIGKIGDEERATLEAVLKAGNEALATITKTVGRDGTGDSSNKAEAQLEALAKARAEEKKISHAKAYDEILRENPELYEASLAG